MTEEEYEEALNRSHQQGISEGLRQGARYVMGLAKESFERFGCDNDKAGRLRTIANDLHTEANKADPGALDHSPDSSTKRGK